MSTLKTSTALLAGMAAGAVLGLLIAPKSGEETREGLSAAISDWGNAVKGAVTMRLEKLSDFKSHMLEALNRNLFGIEPEELPDDLEHA